MNRYQLLEESEVIQMNRKEVIKHLKAELSMDKTLIEIISNTDKKKLIMKRIQAYEFILNELYGAMPRVKINEFLDSNKNWCIRVLVNGELIDNENIEFISTGRTAQERYIVLTVDSKEIAFVVIDKLKEQKKQSNITLIPV